MNGLKRSLRIFAVLLCFSVLPEKARGQLQLLQTRDLRIVYQGHLQAYLVPHIARCYQNSLRFHTGLYGYQLSGPLSMVVHDGSDFNNAGASTVPFNGITLSMAPPSYAFETMPANERFNATLNHELVHIVVNDQTAGTDRLFRRLFFGKIKETAKHPETIVYSYLTGPRRSAPRWYQEGIAVFLETWMAGGLGRALGGYDEMVFRTLVRDSSRMYDLIGLESEGSQTDFQVEVNSYLYGTRFMTYLALVYSPEQVVAWTRRTGGTQGYFAAEFKRQFGRSLDDAWRDWLLFEQAFQQENLDSIRQYPVTPIRPLTSQALGSVSRAHYDPVRDELLVGVNYPGELAYIASIKPGSGDIRKVTEIKGPALYSVTSLAYDQSTGTIFYTADNNGWRDLRSVEIAGGKSRTLLKDARVGDLTFNSSDQGLWGIRHFNGITSLVRIPPPYDKWQLIHDFPYGRDLYGLSLSHDGRQLAAGLSAIDGTQKLILMATEPLLKGDTTWRELFDFGNSLPANFGFSLDDRYLIGTSYYSGVSNIYRYDLLTDSMQGGSNNETGLFSPIQVSDDSLIAFAFSARGFVPVMLPHREVTDVSAIRFLGQQVVEQHPVVTTWLAGRPGDIDLDSLTEYRGPYRALQAIRLVNLYPIIQGYGSYPASGVHLEFCDPINWHQLEIAATFSTQSAIRDNERVHLDCSYRRGAWSASARYNAADFYDLFGPTRTSRKGYSLGITHSRTLLSDAPKMMGLDFGLTGYGGLSVLPEYQNIASVADRYLDGSVSLGYSHQVSSLGAVDSEKGLRWLAHASGRLIKKKVFSRYRAEADLGVPFIFPHASVWLRAAAGFSPDDRAEPLANYFFGGFGNNWIDHQAVKRYRAYYAFPGLELNEVGGANFVRGMLEWNLPPLRFRRVGIASFYLQWLRTSVFATGLGINLDDPGQYSQLLSAGAQSDLRFTLLSHLRLTFSVGYGRAHEEGYRPTDEWMFSLKVL